MHATALCAGDIDLLRCDGKLFMNSDGKGTFTHDTNQDIDVSFGRARMLMGLSMTGYPKCGLADVNADGAPSFHVHGLSYVPKILPKAAQIYARPRLAYFAHPVLVCPARTPARLANGRLALTSHPKYPTHWLLPASACHAQVSSTCSSTAASLSASRALAARTP